MSERFDVWIQQGSTLSALRSVLNSWVEECARYGGIVDDHCWWYNERANVSILAIAAARADWAALEEFGTEKRRESAAADEHGRCDLYLAHPTGPAEFAIEAKLAWQSYLDPDAPRDAITEQWREALKDARKLRKDEAETRVAALFVVPRVKEQAFDPTVVIDDVLALPGVEACAYYFCTPDSRLQGAYGHYFPGVLLALRARQRGF